MSHALDARAGKHFEAWWQPTAEARQMPVYGSSSVQWRRGGKSREVTRGRANGPGAVYVGAPRDKGRVK